jgi:hypothetical protein
MVADEKERFVTIFLYPKIKKTLKIYENRL